MFPYRPHIYYYVYNITTELIIILRRTTHAHYCGCDMHLYIGTRRRDHRLRRGGGITKTQRMTDAAEMTTGSLELGNNIL